MWDIHDPFREVLMAKHTSRRMKDRAIAVVMIFVMFVILLVLRYRDAHADEIDPTACRSMQTHPPGEPWRYGMRVAM